MILDGVPVSCINKAALEYHIPALAIVSILETERGKVGTASVNKNGSIDYGPMQINSLWLKKLNKYGYTKEDIQYNACINAEVGTWILAQNIANGKNWWHGVGGYNSFTPNLNLKYSMKIKNNYEMLTSL